MDQAEESSLGDKGEKAGESEEMTTGQHRGNREETDGDRDADKEAASEEGKLKSQDVWDLTAAERKTHHYFCSKTTENQLKKNLKIDTKEKKEKKQKVDEDEIQKMQILVSSFSEEQLNHYEMYRRSAFPKAVIKRLIQWWKKPWMCVRSGERCHHYSPNT
uniref:transcription initiation factor TFIID subunit 11-like isoform X2 n=1 Tax=Jaculus jaculus TaxID=51337 RepID=UPI001E1B4973|nr:transcription initiation factor TFIID subunit 11-like isoform X2 [Jaculus jaculus]